MARVLLVVGAMTAARAEPVRVLTFVEVRSDATEHAGALLRQYARALREGATPPEVDVLQEIGRPERFVLLVRAEDETALSTRVQRAQAILQSLDPLLTAPLDRRANHLFVPPCAAARGSRVAHAEARGEAARSLARRLYTVAHLDLAGPVQPGPQAALQQLAARACESAGNMWFEVGQQINRGNHFNLVAHWESRRDVEAFAGSAPAREFRARVGPWLGSPYDERLYRTLGGD